MGKNDDNITVDISTVQTDLAPLANEVATMKQQAEALVIKTDADFTIAVESASVVNDKAKAMEKLRKVFVDPLNAQVKNINAMFKPGIEEADSVVRIIKAKMSAFQTEQEEKARAAQKILDDRRAAADAKRIADGKEEIAAPVRQVEAPQKTAVVGTASSTMRKVWKHEIESIDALPADIKKAIFAEAFKKGIIDTVIRNFIKAGLTEISGVRTWQENEVALGKSR